jgi:membrane-associated phospholipid phosphatase
MRELKFPSREELEKFIPYPFVAVWLICGIAVFVEARGLGGHAQAVDVVYDVLLGVTAGYFAGGIAVSLLSVAHSCVSRFLGANGCHAHACVGMPAAGFSESRLRLMFLAFLLAGAAALGVDCPLAQWCLAENCPRWLHDFLDACAVLGTGMGVFLVVLAIHQLDPRRRRALWWVVACVVLSSFAANGGKMLIARTRPRDFNFAGNVCTTFAGWLPPTNVRQSFPSGHAAAAAGLALALLPLYPNGRRLFPLLAVLVAASRVECGAHYLSDVLCGAAVSCLTVACCLRLVRWFPWLRQAPSL